MLETLIMKTTPIPKGDYTVNINFEDSAIGSLDIIDQGTQGMVFTRQTSNLTGNPGVVDTQWGKCFQTNGSVNYLCTNGKLFNFITASTDKEMTIEFVMRTTDTSVARYIASSGDYPSSSIIRSGWAFTTQLSAGYFGQLFVTDAAGNYNRVVVTGDSYRVNDVVRKYVMQYKASTNQIRMIDVTYNRTGAWFPRMSNVETYARLFASHGNGAAASFLFKSLTIGNKLTIT